MNFITELKSISIDESIHEGEYYFIFANLPVSEFFIMLSTGWSLEQITIDFPDINGVAILEAFKLAGKVLQSWKPMSEPADIL